MRGGSFTRTAARTFVLAALLAATILASSAPGRAGPTSSLSYTVTPMAYNNTVQVASLQVMDDPRIAVGPDPTDPSLEDVYVVGLVIPSAGGCWPGADALIVIRSTDGGGSYGPPIRLNGCLPGTRIDAVVLANGTLVVSAPGPLVLRTRDGGQTWATTTLATAAADTSLALDAATGALYLAMTTSTAVEVASSRDGGASWSTPVIAASVGTTSELAARAGHVVLGFLSNGPAVVTSLDGGTTWSGATSLATPGSYTSVTAPSVTVSSSGDFAAAWYQQNQSVSDSVTVSAISRDGGSTWSVPVPVGGLPFLQNALTEHVTAFDTEGRLFVTWLNFNPANGWSTITVANSTQSVDSFQSYGFSVVFQGGSSNVSQVVSLAADSSGRVFVVWGGFFVGVFVRTITGIGAGDVQVNPTAAIASANVTLRSTTPGGAVRQVNWTGQAFTVPELAPDDYQVWIDTANGSSLAGVMPIEPWSLTSFVVTVSLSSGGPPPVRPPSYPPHAPPGYPPITLPVIVPPSSGPFPWLVLEVLLGGLAASGAALAAIQYTRLTRETVLQRRVRLVLYDYVCDNPGASFSAARDALGLQNGAATYHLAVLEKQGLLHSEMKGRRHFYYPSGDASLWKDLPLSGLQTSILQAVRTTPGIGLRELGRAIGRRPSSVGYNVKALAREGLLRTDRDGLRLRCYTAEASSSD